MALATAPLLGIARAGSDAMRLAGPRQQGRYYRWRWKEDEAEAAFWSEWFGIPAVDMSLGRLTAFSLPASADPVAARGHEHAVGAANDGPPLTDTAGVATNEGWAALQHGFDEVLGVGAVHIRRSFGSAVPWLVIDPSVPADVLPGLQPGIEALLPPPLAQWMQAQVALGAMHGQTEAVCDARHAQVQAWASEAMAADLVPVPAAHWQALGLLAEFAVVQAQGPAARLISMRSLRQKYLALPQPVATPVQRAWLDIALRAAGQLRGAAVQTWLDEAQAIATRLMTEQPLDMEGPRLLAEVLLQSALICNDDAAVALLGRAAGLAELALSRGGGAECALTIAEVALAWSHHVDPAIATQLLEQGLLHCADAMRTAHCAKAAARCTLKLRVALAAVPVLQESAHVDAADDEPQALELPPISDAESAVAQLIQQGAFAAACECAEQTSRERAASAGLIALWEQASAAWHAQRPQGADRLRWQDNVRSREYARLSFPL